MERKNAWAAYDAAGMEKIEAFAKAYCAYIDGGKTERECVAESVTAAKAAGFEDLKDVIASGKALAAGDKVYVNWMNKSFVCFVIGSEPMESGMNILGAHIDSPRIDVKQNPLYEDSDLAYLDTHYYGGIKKYQWVAQPLALHGVICRKDGTTVTVAIGEDAADPVFYISDLLPHLAQEQMTKTAAKAIEGEELNLIIGGMPVKAEGEEKASVTAGVLAILKEKYGVEEEDFLSAELEIVPAGKAREVGFDRSMIAAYGHDDRVCAYPSMQAVLDFEGTPKYTLCAVLTDKEEIGSVGATGMNSRFFENIVAELCDAAGAPGDLALRRTLQNSRMLSSDVSAGFDPNFPGAFEKKNAAFLGRGVCFNKYTGSRGKSGSSDANAEYIAQLRRILDQEGVAFQTAELGRVDLGGGGTIAYMCAKFGMNVIDSGVAVLSMHAPYELISKVDLYEAYRCYCTFLRDAEPVK
ncbi:MAG: aminopeptidase [Clostridia bacterium]|nr:aminopeptidase [Clostridia bacterium]MBQ7053387.1 aminopeptidase [Clostridia bacterium]